METITIASATFVVIGFFTGFAAGMLAQAVFLWLASRS